MNIPRVSPSSKVVPTGGTWNKIADAINAPRPATGGGLSGAVSATLQIRNNSGADVDRFGVLGLDGVVYDVTDNAENYKNKAVLDGVEPTAADHETRFVVLDETLKDGVIGRAHASGVCIANVDMQAEGDTHAGITDGDVTKLTSGSGPVEILHAPAGTGEKLCIVRLNASPSPILAKITGDGASDGFYEAEQVAVDGSGDPVTVAGGLTFNAANAGELQESNKTAGIAADSVFGVTRRVTTTGDIRWMFTAGGSALPPPGLENHVLQLNENLEPFWGTVRIASS